MDEQQALVEVYNKQKVFVKTHNKQKLLVEAHNEQQAHVEVYNKQKVPVEAHKKRKVLVKEYDEQQALIEVYNKQETPEVVGNAQKTLEDAQVPKNCENLISYVHKGNKWDRNNVVVNNIFVFQVALDIIQNDEDPKPHVEKCRKRNYGPKWKETMQAKLHSFKRRKVFGHIVQTPTCVKPVGYKWDMYEAP